ncbi:sodium:proton antiporter [Hymenobacter sp. BT186]|uniref:Sodium:proton antiporter n=1 Tax=Hymenobacter telluris TaxID=2816474 RepID=A0A939EV46_9BACT|nr:sodium:proton antiporter [Hymenobacter telluris]MBO0357052.1 sodium:proton antiporter [Hymenobacter telluris]MBW3373079.1 sodium:proton antiporter [Hymenobacter norwichensis]
MDLFTLITLLIVVAALFAYLNTRLLKLPDAIGIMVVSLGFSLALLGTHWVYPDLFGAVRRTVVGIEFDRVLFEVMLSLLLFAGAFHTDAAQLRVERRSVVLFSVVGVLLSTALIGGGLFGLSRWLEPATPLPLPLCLLFGALISPTDPIAVLGILARFKLPENVKLNIVGESLFNDGVGVVVFASLYELVLEGPENFSAGHVAWLFVQEAGGGILFGLVLGYGLYRLLRSINHYQTEVLLTLAGVLGGYLVAQQLHISGPLAMVVAGLFVGDRARQDAMSAQTEEYVDKFWELLDGILNAVLFVLIGVELLVVQFHSSYWLLCGVAIVLVLAARFVAIWLPYRLTRRWLTLDHKAPLMMTWGGLRGGISVALALSIGSNVPHKSLIVAITYAVVVFSVIVQGLTLEKLIRRLYPEDATTDPPVPASH